jgi:hypothetical protein
MLAGHSEATPNGRARRRPNRRALKALVPTNSNPTSNVFMRIWYTALSSSPARTVLCTHCARVLWRTKERTAGRDATVAILGLSGRGCAGSF